MINLDTGQSSFLREVYLKHFPVDIPEGTLDNYEQIILLKDVLRSMLPNKGVLDKLLNITIHRIENKKRFQKLTVIKLIRHHLNVQDLEGNTNEKLFTIFKNLIVDASEEIEWKLTSLLKDKELSAYNIYWLIDNFENSKHIVNRLLRYPVSNKPIYNWVSFCLENGKLTERLSELIGIKLNFKKNFKHDNKVAFVWGIHYSKLDTDTKKDLLLKNVANNTLIDILKICERNLFLDIIAFLYRELNKAS